MRDPFEYFVILFIVLTIATGIFYFAKSKHDCDEAGGKLVRSAWTNLYECVEEKS